MYIPLAGRLVERSKNAGARFRRRRGHKAQVITERQIDHVLPGAVVVVVKVYVVGISRRIIGQVAGRAVCIVLADLHDIGHRHVVVDHHCVFADRRAKVIRWRVGHYPHAELREFIERNFQDIRDRIKVMRRDNCVYILARCRAGHVCRLEVPLDQARNDDWIKDGNERSSPGDR